VSQGGYAASCPFPVAPYIRVPSRPVVALAGDAVTPLGVPAPLLTFLLDHDPRDDDLRLWGPSTDSAGRFLVHDDLRVALVRLDREAREAGRPDLTQHVEGVRLILEGLCQAIDAAKHGQTEGKAGG
jgi:hypothetical protein